MPYKHENTSILQRISRT